MIWSVVLASPGTPLIHYPIVSTVLQAVGLYLVKADAIPHMLVVSRKTVD